MDVPGSVWRAPIALGKAPAGSSSTYIVGTINGVWGVYRSNDGAATSRRINDNKHHAWLTAAST